MHDAGSDAPMKSRDSCASRGVWLVGTKFEREVEWAQSTSNIAGRSVLAVEFYDNLEWFVAHFTNHADAVKMIDEPVD